VEQFSSVWPIFKVSESGTAHSRGRRLRGSSFSSVSSSLSWAVARVGDPGVSVTRTPALVLPFQGESLTCGLGSAAPFDSGRLPGAIGNYCSERSCSRIPPWSCRPQFSTTTPFEKRLKPMVRKSTRFPVAATPRNSPSCVPW